MGLLELAVVDLALIERARISFSPGFTAITGETGAGKSLLIDALGLVLGARADVGLLRQGAEMARVEALFERDPEPMICVRELHAGGRTLARIDDETVTLARLAATAGPLVEIHGQHEQQRLLQAPAQRELLDGFGGHADLLRSVATRVAALRQNAAALQELELSPGELAHRLELAEHTAAEVEAADVRIGEVEELRARLASAANAERLARVSGQLRERLSAEGSGLRDQLGLAAREAAEVAVLEPRVAELRDRLLGLEAEADDITSELGSRLADIAADLGDRERLETRLGVLYGLLRKYGETEQAVLEEGERARTEADRLRGLEAERSRRRDAAERLGREAEAAAEALRAARHAAAGRLGPAVTEALHELGFAAATFSVEVEPAPLDASGADSVAFVLAPNPGEPPRPLARIASGGELSRVSLAIKSVLAAADRTPTLIFDEIDAGIGGRSADPVGARLWRLGRHHQVLCVTHLPQVAAHADAHLMIRKTVRNDGRTVTEIQHLASDAERRQELAAMLGGRAGDPDVARAAAGLLDGATAAHAQPIGSGRA
jgi:DNA repair protein RecN (Recombination protein N)